MLESVLNNVLVQLPTEVATITVTIINYFLHVQMGDHNLLILCTFQILIQDNWYYYDDDRNTMIILLKLLTIIISGDMLPNS